MSHESTIFESTGQATFGTICFQSISVDDPTLKCSVFWETKTDKRQMVLPRLLLQFLYYEFGKTIQICTEYCQNEFTFCCHPCYQSDGPIHDWMKVLFSDGISYPCHLANVVVDSGQSHKLIVQSGKEKTGIKSAVLPEWTWSDQYYIVSPQSIVAPCFVASIMNNSSKILETLPYDDWPAQFTSG